MCKNKLSLTATIPDSMAGLRIDQALARLFPEYSRARLSEWLKSGKILIDQRSLKPKDKVRGGEHLVIDAPLDVQGEWQAQAIDISVVFEDEHIIVINKAADFVVHPGAGNPDQTLVNALLHHSPNLNTLPRAGIIHRLDKDTTGLLVVAKTLTAHAHLVEAMQRREIKRHYLALVYGQLNTGGKIDAPIGRHPKQRIKMAVVKGGKRALTHYRIKQQFAQCCLLDVELDTGRTHQIRVHMQHIKHPIIGDPLYGRSYQIQPTSEPLYSFLQGFNRQALHAYKLSIPHPTKHDTLSFEAPLPDDFRQLLDLLEKSDE